MDDNVLGSISYCQRLKSLFHFWGRDTCGERRSIKLIKAVYHYHWKSLSCQIVNKYTWHFLIKSWQNKTVPHFGQNFLSIWFNALPPAVDCILWMMSYPRTYSIKLYAPHPTVSVIIQNLHEKLSKIAEKDFFLDINPLGYANSGLLLFAIKEFALTWCLQITIPTIPSSLKILHLGVNQITLADQIINQNLSQLTYLNLSSNREINWVSQDWTFLNLSTWKYPTCFITRLVNISKSSYFLTQSKGYIWIPTRLIQ